MSNGLVPVIVLALALFLVSSCDRFAAPQPVGGPRRRASKPNWRDVRFRRFEPSKDASPRRGVILDFSGRVSIWAQYSEDGHAVNEWEIISNDYRIERRGGSSEITIQLDQPRSTQGFPTRCGDCIPTSGVSISIRDVFDRDRISFKVNDPNGILPPPFPVFGSWTELPEDEIME